MAKRKTTIDKKPKRGGRSKAGRPTHFGDVTREIIKKLVTRGFTDEEVAQCLKIKPQTYYNWQKKHPKFFESVKDWKNGADEKVEKSLYERACGYTHPDTKPQWVETTEIIDGEAVKVGKWVYADLVKHYPPDTPAITLWLKNRKPDEWRDKVDHEHTGRDGGPIEQIVNTPPPFKTIEEWEAWKKKNENREK